MKRRFHGGDFLVPCLMLGAGFMVATGWLLYSTPTRPARPSSDPANRLSRTPPSAAWNFDAGEADPEADASRNDEGWIHDPELAEARAENRRLRAQLNDLLEWIVENLSGRFPVPEPMLVHFRPPALMEDFSLHADVADLLRIGPAEQAHIQDALSRAAHVFRVMEEQSAWVEWYSSTEAALHMPADPETGNRLREDLRSAFDQALGDSRAERLWVVTEAGLEDAFQAFGEEDRTLFFSLVSMPDGLPNLLRIRDERSRPGRGDEPTRDRAVEWLSSAPPDTYARFVRLILNAEEGGLFE